MSAEIDKNLKRDFEHFPLSEEELGTCRSMLSAGGDNSCRLVISPTHHVTEFKDFVGFRFDCPEHTNGVVLPVVRTMFHGHTLVECTVKEEFILKLMREKDSNNSTMLSLLTRINNECNPATLDCIPKNESIMTPTGKIEADGLLSVDSQEWTPEVPERLGIYHAYIRGFNRGARAHRLFLVCTGGLNMACNMFCNTVIDVASQLTAGQICRSEEAWWLKKACQRSRCRILKMLADAFSIPVDCIQDVQSYSKCQIAIPTTETLEFNMDVSLNKVWVHNGVTDTTKPMNGMICNMSPSEGVWLFRGAPRSNCYGAMYGAHDVCGFFPTHCPPVMRPQSILVQDADYVVHLHANHRVTGRHYMRLDEAYFKTLESMQWNRDNGFIELIPIVVGCR